MRREYLELFSSGTYDSRETIRLSSLSNHQSISSVSLHNSSVSLGESRSSSEGEKEWNWLQENARLTEVNVRETRECEDVTLQLGQLQLSSLLLWMFLAANAFVVVASLISVMISLGRVLRK